jgi:hypothetical protein
MRSISMMIVFCEIKGRGWHVACYFRMLTSVIPAQAGIHALDRDDVRQNMEVRNYFIERN